MKKFKEFSRKTIGSLAVNLLPPIIFKSLHWNKLAPHPYSKFKAKNGIDKQMLEFINYRDGFFVEIGAGDGVYLSNTHYFEKNLGWQGILVDPVLHHHLSCLTQRPRSISYLCAATNFENNSEYIKLKYGGYSSLSQGVQSDIIDAQQHLDDAANYIPLRNAGVEFIAPLRTMTQILDSSNAPKVIDFFSLDVEGNEIEVLQGIDFSRYQIRWLLVESRDVGRISEYLKPHKYSIKKKLASCDYLFEFFGER
jgi:FkbM family methyltransferase